MPCQKTGTERPSSVPIRVTWSIARSRRTADRIPAATPRTSEKSDGEHGELDRDRKPLEDQGEDRLPGAPGRPEVASNELAEPAAVLDVPGLVEPEEPLELIHHLLAHDRVRADHLLHDGAWNEAEHEEDQDREP